MSLSNILVPNNYKIYAGTIDANLGTFNDIVVQNDTVTTNLIVDNIIYTDSTKGSVLVADGNSYNPLNVGADGEVLIADSTAPKGIKWVVPTTATGDVDGPASATDNAVARYDGITGKLIQNSAVTISDGGVISGLVDAATWQSGADAVTNVKIGDSAVAASADQIALLGSVTGANGTAIGDFSTATAQWAMGVGWTALATAQGATALGVSTTAGGTNSIAAGSNSTAAGNQGTAVGYLSSAGATSSTAIGHLANASFSNATAVGLSATASNTNTTAVGNGAVASGTQGTAVGYLAAAGTQGIAVGSGAIALGTNTIAFGKNTTATASGDISIGNTAGTTDVAGTGVIKLANIPAPTARAASTNTVNVPITINGTIYYLMASTVN